MMTNPAHPTSMPSGKFHLWQFDPSQPVYIWGYMKQLPYKNQRYGFSINERPWNGKDCCSAGNHLQTSKQMHGWNSDSWRHHTGDLWSI